MTKTAAAPSGAETTSAGQNLPVETKQTGTELAVADDDLFAQHAGAGLQNVTARDILIPRLSIIQSNSPQLLKSKAEYIEGAKVGDILDVNMGEIIGDEMLFIPILFTMAWLEWAPRASGKGLIAIHPTDEILAKTHPEGGENDSKRPILPNGNYIAETAQFYGLNVTKENRLSFLPMVSTQLKKARQLNTLATSEKVRRADGSEFTPPMFYRMYKFTVVPESNSKGDWMGWKIERGPRLQDMEGWKDLFQRMVTYSSEISAGQRRGDISGLQDEAGDTSSASADESRSM